MTKRHYKSEVTLYCRKYDPDFACQDEFKLNADNLLPSVLLDSYLYVGEQIYETRNVIINTKEFTVKFTVIHCKKSAT